MTATPEPRSRSRDYETSQPNPCQLTDLVADAPARPDVNPTPDPHGPVDAHDRTLANLEWETRRQGRSGRWVAASMVAIAVGFVVLLAIVVPAQFSQAFGLADVRVAVVEGIATSKDQPSPGSVRRSGPEWDVQVRWEGDGGVHRGSGIARGDNPPYQVGEEVDIATVGDGNEVSLRSRVDARGVLAAILGVVAICFAVAGYYWFRSRAWRPLSISVTKTAPKRVQVQRAPYLVNDGIAASMSWREVTLSTTKRWTEIPTWVRSSCCAPSTARSLKQMTY